MGYTTVRAHARRGYQVRAHSRRTNDWHIADILQCDLDRVFERLDREDVAPVGPVGGDPDCPHPSWYPVRHVDGTRILAYACTDCAATKAATEARERVLAEGEEGSRWPHSSPSVRWLPAQGY